MIPADKLKHIALGILWLAVALLGYQVYAFFGLGPMLAYQTTAYALLYEINQLIRHEGQPELLDAAATALPGFVAWGLLAAAQ